MQQQYPFKELEQQAQQYWESNKTFAASETSSKPKYYCLSMFPYPRDVYKRQGRNPVPMLLWALCITVIIGFGFATSFLGLIVAMPVVGHASWHVYRDLVEEIKP